VDQGHKVGLMGSGPQPIGGSLKPNAEPKPGASSTKPKPHTQNRDLKGKAPTGSEGAPTKFPLKPKSHLLKWKNSKGASLLGLRNWGTPV
jgi:hypothetical protein